MNKRSGYFLSVAVAILLVGGAAQAQMFDITNPGDPVVGVPNDNNWPAAEAPPNAIDNVVSTKYLCFKTSFIPDATGGSGFRVTPSGPRVVVKALNFAMPTMRPSAIRSPSGCPAPTTASMVPIP